MIVKKTNTFLFLILNEIITNDKLTRNDIPHIINKDTFLRYIICCMLINNSTRNKTIRNENKPIIFRLLIFFYQLDTGNHFLCNYTLFYKLI